MMPNKLSPAQVRALRAMQQGSRLHYFRGVGCSGHHTLSSDPMGTNISSATVSALLDRGFIEIGRTINQPGTFRRDFVLTETGKGLILET